VKLAKPDNSPKQLKDLLKQKFKIKKEKPESQELSL
jgi:DNA polymerase I-like protein with 3'-5' exonuclease and polymerase domains